MILYNCGGEVPRSFFLYLLAGLEGVHVGVGAFLIEKLGVRSSLDDLGRDLLVTFVERSAEDDDFVGFDDGLESVCDDNDGFPFAFFVENFADFVLGEAVECGGRLVEDDDVGVF